VSPSLRDALLRIGAPSLLLSPRWCGAAIIGGFGKVTNLQERCVGGAGHEFARSAGEKVKRGNGFTD